MIVIMYFLLIYQNLLDFCLTKDYNQYCSDSSFGNSANAHGVFGGSLLFFSLFLYQPWQFAYSPLSVLSPNLATVATAIFPPLFA